MADNKTAPFSTGGFFLVQLVLMIPFVNLILLLIFAFSGSVNVNLQNYSKSVLIWMLVALAISITIAVIGALAAGGIGIWLENLNEQYQFTK
jgi:hypothetical protein